VAVNEVDVPYTGNKAGRKGINILFFEKAMSGDVIEQFTARGVIENDAGELVGFDNVV
jgi:hypothetical protein